MQGHYRQDKIARHNSSRNVKNMRMMLAACDVFRLLSSTYKQADLMVSASYFEIYSGKVCLAFLSNASTRNLFRGVFCLVRSIPSLPFIFNKYIGGPIPYPFPALSPPRKSKWPLKSN